MILFKLKPLLIFYLGGCALETVVIHEVSALNDIDESHGNASTLSIPGYPEDFPSLSPVSQEPSILSTVSILYYSYQQ